MSKIPRTVEDPPSTTPSIDNRGARHRRHTAWLAGLALAVVAACGGSDEPDPVLGSTSAAVIHPRLQVGVRGASDYQNAWQVTLGNTWNNCSGFGSQISSTDDWIYYYNLNGAKPSLEETGDAWGTAYGSTDTVDLFFMETHGGNWGTDAVWAAWDQGSIVYSNAMRLGDDSRQLSVLSTLSCDVLAVADGGFVGRWYKAFAGGLRLSLGGWDLLYDSAGIGASFASRLQSGATFGDAFAGATIGGDGRAKPAVAAAAIDANSCWPRLGASVVNIFSQSRVRDSSIGYMCWVTWN
jgi:hypothetical protein